MEFLMYLTLAFIVLGVIMIILNVQSNNGNIQHEIEATYIEGIDNLIGEYKCKIKNLDNMLLIEIKKNNLKIELPYSKIISIGTKIETHQEISGETKTKSPVARGVIGGVVAGSTGAVLGGMSGLNSKTEINTSIIKDEYLQIKYKTNEEKEKILIFDACCPRLNKICQ